MQFWVEGLEINGFDIVGVETELTFSERATPNNCVLSTYYFIEDSLGTSTQGFLFNRTLKQGVVAPCLKCVSLSNTMNGNMQSSGYCKEKQNAFSSKTNVIYKKRYLESIAEERRFCRMIADVGGFPCFIMWLLTNFLWSLVSIKTYRESCNI